MKYLRRGIWYLASRLLLICIILALMIVVFYYAMNVTNIQIILKDGMAARAKYVMGIDSNLSELDKYFSSQYIRQTVEPKQDKSDQDPNKNEQADPVKLAYKGESPYADYTIRGIDHRLDVDFFWVWPWEDENIVITIPEKIPRIDGRVKGTIASEVIREKGSEAVYPPAWEEAAYRVTLKKDGTQWKISRMERMK